MGQGNRPPLPRTQRPENQEPGGQPGTQQPATWEPAAKNLEAGSPMPQPTWVPGAEANDDEELPDAATEIYLKPTSMFHRNMILPTWPFPKPHLP